MSRNRNHAESKPGDLALISARGLKKTYYLAGGQAIEALSDVDFDVRSGEFISIVGPSGCGKSTLLKILAGLLPYREGEVELAGKPIGGPNPEIGMVFQSPVLLPWRTILENILLPIEFRRAPLKEFQGRARSLLKTVGLEGFEDRYPMELSGGMQQRAAIVRALIQDPKVLLMDEPFGALDAMTREQMNLEVLRIWQESRKTILFVTHSISEAVFLASRVFVMTVRPARLAEIIDIDIPYPRDLSVINTDKFGEYSTSIRELLHARGGIA